VVLIFFRFKVYLSFAVIVVSGAALLITGTNGALASPARNSTAGTSATITVKLEVRSSLGVSLKGEPSLANRVIKVGDPASGMVTYVVLDG
jgi:hypothetical protein